MKQYPKTYESVFLCERSLKKCDIEKVGVGGNINISAQKYISMLFGTMMDMEKSIFDYLVKMAWLFRKFRYDSRGRDKIRRNGFTTDSSFGVFLRYFVGIEHRVITRNNLFPKVISYFDDFFPLFDERNPFEENLKYPFKNIGLEFLTVVYQMKERMELLEYCESVNMKYLEFLDYVFNYVCSYNEECGFDQYTIIVSKNHFQPYIRINKRRNKKYSKH